MHINPDEITSILKSRIEGLDAGSADGWLRANQVVLASTK